MGANFSKQKNIKKVSTHQQQQQGMTKKQRKAAMWTEVGRLNEKIPYMWSDFAMQIAYHNIDNPKNKITDAFLIKVVKQGEKMSLSCNEDVEAMTHLNTNNSKTNYHSLKRLMGNQLFSEVLEAGISWGYFASLYQSIYEKKFFG